MKKSTIIAAVLGVVLGFCGGAFFGVHRLWAVIRPSIDSEFIANVNFAVEDLVWHRTGKHDRALAFMEQRLDGAISAIPRGRPLSELSTEERQALLVAKVYRSRFPFEAASSHALSTLAALPEEPLDPASCSPAVKFLLSDSSGG